MLRIIHLFEKRLRCNILSIDFVRVTNCLYDYGYGFIEL